MRLPLTRSKELPMTPLEQANQPEPPPPASPLGLLPLLAMMAIVAGAVYWVVSGNCPLCPRAAQEPDARKGVGQPLPFVEVRPLTGDGTPVSIAELKDHVTLLNLWGPWCPPCRSELSHMAELAKRFAGHEAFRLLAISYPQSGPSDDVQSLRENTEALLRQLKVDVPTYYDPGDATEAAVRNLIAEKGYPTSVLLDRQGVIRAIWVGYRPGLETEMERHIGLLLEEKVK
jgi:cytochrome c biogenesis protein CcmG, thiol:disulfide interchange protein DsbE